MISVILPLLNNAQDLEQTANSLTPEADGIEIIGVDGGSTDDTVAQFSRHFPAHRCLRSERGRARQMNAGATAAKGDILLFLHSDTQLAPGWRSAVEQAAADENFLLGAFAFALDEPGFRFRLIEWGVRWRCRLFQLPYGDQALFVKRKDFKAWGKFPEQPLMEDVELVWKARSKGRLSLLPLSATTSALKWKRDGVLRRTWRNWSTYRQYKRGKTQLASLHQNYEGNRAAIWVFCKEPVQGKVKTRLAASIGEEKATDVYRQLVQHTIQAVASSPADKIFCFAPADAEKRIAHWLDHPVVIPQAAGDLGDRMLHAFRQSRSMGYDKTVIIGTDCPELAPQHLAQALDLLDRYDLVIGPAHDGGYYLIAAREAHEALFRDIPWSTDAVLDSTLRSAEDHELTYATLPALSDLDTVDEYKLFRSMLNV